VRNKKLFTAVLTILAFMVGTFFGQERFVREYIEPHIPEIIDQVQSQQAEYEEEHAAQNFYSIIRIADGDTFTIDKGGEEVTLRLLGIDTPEKKSSFTEEECYGVEATQIIKRLLDGEEIRYETSKLSGELDRYGRVLAYVYLDDGTFVNAELVKRGVAMMYEKNTTHEHYDSLKILEIEAQKQGVGLWSVCKV